MLWAVDVVRRSMLAKFHEPRAVQDAIKARSDSDANPATPIKKLALVTESALRALSAIGTF